MKSFKNGLQFLRDMPITELVSIAGNILQVEEDQNGSSIFSKSRTFWLFLHQMLAIGGTCRDAVRKAQAWLAMSGAEMISSSTSAYCQARKRLPMDMVENVLKQSAVGADGEDNPEWLWCGRRVRVVDGSSAKMSDTAENQKEFPQSASQKRGCGFPIMKFVGIFSLATGLLTAIKTGNKHCSEISLFRLLFPALPAGDVVLGDRGFCSYADIWMLREQGVDVVMRKHQKRSVGSRRIRKLGKEDYLVEWYKSSRKPAWMEEEEWNKIPERLVVREIFVNVIRHGFRTKNLTVVTTLSDNKIYTKDSLSQLYLRRWNIELYFRDIKTTMGFDVLRSKTPEMVKKELLMALTAYNVIRRVMMDVANYANVGVENISFKGTWSALEQWLPMFNRITNQCELLGFYSKLIHVISKDLLLIRPGRREPRATKLRPKAYSLLNKHRREFVEIPHRSKYRKANGQ